MELCRHFWSILICNYVKLFGFICKRLLTETISNFKKKFRVPCLATCIFFLFNYWMNQDWVQESILAWLWHHFHLVLDEIWTHDLPIVSQVRTFAPTISNFVTSFVTTLNRNYALLCVVICGQFCRVRYCMIGEDLFLWPHPFSGVEGHKFYFLAKRHFFFFLYPFCYYYLILLLSHFFTSKL